MSDYADLIKNAIIDLGNNEQARAEKITIKATNEEELRFSWWTKNGSQFVRTPLDLPEDDWIRLFNEAVKKDVLSQDFIKKLIKVLANGLK